MRSKTLWWLGWLMAGGPVLGAPDPSAPPSQNPDRLYADALELLAAPEPDLSLALHKLEQADRNRPNHAPTLAAISGAAFLAGRWSDALEAAERAIRADPSLAAAYRNRGDARLQLGKAREAAADFRKSIELGLDDAKTHYNLGMAHFALNELEPAIGAMRRAIDREPNFGMARMNLGAMLGIRDEWDEGLAQLIEAKALMPREPKVHLNLARLYELRKEPIAMRESACRFLALDGHPAALPAPQVEQARAMLGGHTCPAVEPQP